MMDKKTIDEFRALHVATTTGHWIDEYSDDAGYRITLKENRNVTIADVRLKTSESEEGAFSNGRFIAHVHQHIPELLTELETHMDAFGEVLLAKDDTARQKAVAERDVLAEYLAFTSTLVGTTPVTEPVPHDSRKPEDWLAFACEVVRRRKEAAKRGECPFCESYWTSLEQQETE